MKKNLSACSVAIGIAIVFSSCTGPAGPDGPQGAPGGNGVTNITFYPFTILAADWSLQGGIDSNGFKSIPVSVATLIQQASPDAQVEVYYSLSSPDQGPWTALPYSGIFYGPGQISSNDTIVDQLGYQFDFANPGQLNLLYSFIFHHYTYHTQRPKATIYGLISVIPQVIMKRHPNFNWKDGNAVMQLPEVKAALISANK
ncbi:MAG: hypothetical protein HKL88_10410 [Bacteroidia bacterium]|nr:hypothetical protein [Bacteroidia bacterium]